MREMTDKIVVSADVPADGPETTRAAGDDGQANDDTTETVVSDGLPEAQTMDQPLTDEELSWARHFDSRTWVCVRSRRKWRQGWARPVILMHCQPRTGRHFWSRFEGPQSECPVGSILVIPRPLNDDDLRKFGDHGRRYVRALLGRGDGAASKSSLRSALGIPNSLTNEQVSELVREFDCEMKTLLRNGDDCCLVLEICVAGSGGELDMRASLPVLAWRGEWETYLEDATAAWIDSVVDDIMADPDWPGRAWPRDRDVPQVIVGEAAQATQKPTPGCTPTD